MIKNLKILFFLWFILISHFGLGQFLYGVQVQASAGGIKGSAIADSISLISDSRASLRFQRTIGVFLEYRLKSKLPLILRSEVNYRPSPLGLDVSIFNGKSFNGKPIGVYTYKSLNFAFDVPITINYNIIQKERLSFVKLRDLEIGIFAGLTFQFQSRSEKETYPIGKNLNSSGISDVNFSIYNSIRTINYFYNYGIRARLGHFIATYRRDMLLTQSGTNDLEVWGNIYSYKTIHQYESVSLGYTFSFKRRE